MKKLLISICFFLALSIIWADAFDPPTSYYSTCTGLSSDNLRTAINNRITAQFSGGPTYRQYNYDDLWDELSYTDADPANGDNVLLLYTGRSQDSAYRDRGSSWDYSQYDGGNGTYGDSWNREHVWAKSQGDFGTYTGPGTDLHHLRPADRSVNSSRGNKDFDNGGYAHGEVPYTYTDTDSWEPRDAVKGDVARMILYMDVRYDDTADWKLICDNSVDSNDTPDPNPNGYGFHGRLSTLLTWHESDPPDTNERRRNQRIYERQGNRNPFIDHPEYVSYIWGGLVPAPTVATYSADNISYTTATLGGNITTDGHTIDERGIVFALTSENTNPQINGIACTKNVNGSGGGIFSELCTGFTAGSNYSFRAYAIFNTSQIAYGNVLSFGTNPYVLATVYTGDASSVTTQGAVLAGAITENGGVAVSERGIILAPTVLNSNPQIGGTSCLQMNLGDGVGMFSGNTPLLASNTMYTYRAYAQNAVGIAYASVDTFSTYNINPPLVNVASSVAGSSFVANWETVNLATSYILDVATSDSFTPASGSSAWINEIHYDNAGADAQEGIEIAGNAGVDLSNYAIYMYNGYNGTIYAEVTNLTGTISNQGAGFGAVWVAILGVQNGAPDGVCLAKNDEVIQLLSWEGEFTASEGIAIGITSTDIGVSQTYSNPVTSTLQLSGTGNVYADFVWQGPVTATRGTLNAGQNFSVQSGGDFVDGYQNLEIMGGETTSYVVSSLNNMTDYYYRLRAKNLQGTSSYSATIHVYTQAVNPPENIVITVDGNNWRINWDVVTGATSYNVYSSTDATASYPTLWSIVASEQTPNYILIPIVTSEVSNYFRITANF